MNTSLFNTILLGDGRLPSGGYSDSAGLEPAVNAGLTLKGTYAYMLARLQTITKMEATASVLAHRLTAQQADVCQFKELEAAVNARTSSPAQRKASRFMGRAMLYLAEGLKPNHPVLSTLDRLSHTPSRGIALGALAALLDVSEEGCAQVCCFDDMQRISEAVLKLLPTDPIKVTRWSIAAGKKVPKIVKSAQRVRKPSDLPAITAPLMEHWAEAHDKRTKRLFMA